MNLVQLRYVLELAACGNFTRAAENLCVTQPAVSHQLKTLEKELGITPVFSGTPMHFPLLTKGKNFADAEKSHGSNG